MSKIAFVFPGQGAQSLGMGKELYENHEIAKATFEKISDLSFIDIKKICFGDDASLLTSTENCQMSLFALSASCLALMGENNVTASAVAGFSLGECTALYASGILSVEDTVKLILLRGQAMKSASERSDGMMCAVLGLDGGIIDNICKSVTSTGVGFVGAVNYNSAAQTVIAGERNAVEAANTLLTEAGASKIVPLSVSGAFHTRLMDTAGIELESAVADFAFAAPSIPLYTNVTGAALPADTAIPNHMKIQMTNPVRWQTSVENMTADGIDTFIELGAGRVLSGLIKRISRTSVTANVEDERSLEKTFETLRS